MLLSRYSLQMQCKHCCIDLPWRILLPAIRINNTLPINGTSQQFLQYPAEFHCVFLLKELFTTKHIIEDLTVFEACSQVTRMHEAILVSGKNLVLPEIICLLHTKLCYQHFYSTEVLEVCQAHFGTRASHMVTAFTTEIKKGGSCLNLFVVCNSLNQFSNLLDHLSSTKHNTGSKSNECQASCKFCFLEPSWSHVS